MDELIKVDFSSDRPLVSARDLHAFLEVGTQYNKWFSRMCESLFSISKCVAGRTRLFCRGNIEVLQVKTMRRGGEYDVQTVCGGDTKQALSTASRKAQTFGHF